MRLMPWPKSISNVLLNTQRTRRTVRRAASVAETLEARTVLSSISLSRQHGTVSVDEGRHAHNFGYATSSAGVTSVTSNVGTVDFDSYWGLWQWNDDPTDGPANSQVVEITAIDGDGDASSLTFQLHVLNVAPSLQLASANASTYQGITFQHGDASFADAVTDLSLGSNTVFTDATRALGAPTGGDNSQGVTLGNGGSVTLEFTDLKLVDQNYVSNNADLYIYDLGIDAEEILLDISVDGTTWISMPAPIPLTAGEPTGIDISAIATPGTEYSYVRITDVFYPGEHDPYYVGPDVDAVGVIGAVDPVIVNAGDLATRHGSFTDVGANDLVSLSASVGTITQTGTHAGSWTWSSPTQVTDGNSIVTITAIDSDGGVSTASFDLICINPEVEVDLDIVSGPLNLNGLVNSSNSSSRVVSVAIYSTSDFNVLDIDRSSLVLANAAVFRSQFRDLDGDGDLDLVASFRLQDTNLVSRFAQQARTSGRTRGTATMNLDVELTGFMDSGIAIRGNESLQVFASGSQLNGILNSV